MFATFILISQRRRVAKFFDLKIMKEGFRKVYTQFFPLRNEVSPQEAPHRMLPIFIDLITEILRSSK
ncbi:hypothetical protein BXU01_19915 [[Flexibacter] sp. ATCC 35103]|nr:hypothetical protein BXU01_19915 [[Flexibacter] sp. ATCC 35103]